MQQELVIIRGIPGSGKSTLAVTKFPNCTMYSNDDFFMANGEYKWDKRFTEMAYALCLGRTGKALYEKHARVVVHNVFSSYYSLRSYLKLAGSLRVPVRIITCQNNFGSIHGVPEESMSAIKQQILSNDQIRDILSKEKLFTVNVSYEEYHA